jgi:hypothetical protein
MRNTSNDDHRHWVIFIDTRLEKQTYLFSLYEKDDVKAAGLLKNAAYCVLNGSEPGWKLNATQTLMLHVT